MSSMTPRKMGMAKYLWVSTWSILSERCCSAVACGLTTVLATRAVMYS